MDEPDISLLKGTQAFVGKYPWETAISEWEGKWEEIGWKTPLPLVNAAFTMKDGPPPTCTYSADVFNPVENEVKHLAVTMAYTAHMVTGHVDYLEYIKHHLKKALEAQVAAEAQKVAEAMAKKQAAQQAALYESVYAPSGAIIAIGGWSSPKMKTIYDLFPDEPEDSHQGLARELRKQAPGLNEETGYPCGCVPKATSSIWSVIQHLNDGHHPMKATSDPWTRERIADWLDALDADLTIHTKEEA